MLDKLLSRLGGQVRVRVECGYPERVMNLCARRGLSFWDLSWESPTAFSLRLSRRDWKSLREEAASLGCEFRVLERSGVPYLAAQLWNRPALAITLAVWGAALFLGSFFIWDFEIQGNETVPEERILRALERQGVGLGSFGLVVDGEDLRNHVLLEIPELQWIAVNVSGCRAHVQVRERREPPEIADLRTPSNVIARRDGLVLEVQALDGEAAVLPGMTVTAGQLLISGREELETTGTVRVMPGHGSVKARTWHSLTTVVSLKSVEKQPTGVEKTGLSLILGRRRIKFFSNRGVAGLEAGREYDKMTERVPLRFFGVPLPLTVVREQYRFYESVPMSIRAAEAQRRGEAALRSQLEREAAPYGEVRSALVSARQRGDALEVTLTAECVEEIGVRVPMELSGEP